MDEKAKELNFAMRYMNRYVAAYGLPLGALEKIMVKHTWLPTELERYRKSTNKEQGIKFAVIYSLRTYCEIFEPKYVEFCYPS